MVVCSVILACSTVSFVTPVFSSVTEVSELPVETVEIVPVTLLRRASVTVLFPSVDLISAGDVRLGNRADISGVPVTFAVTDVTSLIVDVDGLAKINTTHMYAIATLKKIDSQ